MGMEFFVEQAENYAACLQKIRARYGSAAKPISQRTIQMGGILGFFTRDGVEISYVITQEPLRTAAAPRREADFEEEKKKILASVKAPDPTLQLVLKEVRSLTEKIDANASAGSRSPDVHPSIQRIHELLSLNDFSPAMAQSIEDRIRREFSLEQLDDYDAVQDRVIDWIGESVQIYREEGFQSRPRVMVLVGPTGVGKTTTIAKLAAMYSIGSSSTRPISVRMITIDNYRIGAKQQIETYGRIMNIPVSSVENFDDLRKTIALYSEGVDLILVDTIGKSPRDFMQLAEMKALLSACGSGADVHLGLSATTKYSDMKEILQQFEPFNYRSVVITKLDETIRVGNVVSALAEKGKAISWVTNGQKVPNDITRATVVRLLMNLEGFRIDRRRVDDRFPPDIPVQTKEWR